MANRMDHASPPTITQVIAQLLDRGAVGVVVTVMRGPAIGSKLLLDEQDVIAGTLGNTELDVLVKTPAAEFLKSRHETRMFSVSDFAPSLPLANERLLLFERLQPAPRLVVCGAGHVGAALAKLASFLGYETTLIDDRAEFLEGGRFPEEQIKAVVADDWATAVSDAIGNGHGVSVAVVTRGHNEDERCMQAVVPAAPDYIGLIGSKRRTSIVIDRLREKGATEEQLRKIHAPIGLDIGAVSPEEVALAIIAEIVAVRRGAVGGSLSDWRRRA
ncbi:MAG TPA: XdhC family protein [Pyrinomonadaceae bacterium]|jgi:xanthine dehydrogenase accessory factor|nr:XdhC family protein [Pyrinomonadaceae bacterium]